MMARHTRAPRPYRGGKRGRVVSLANKPTTSVPKPERSVSNPGLPGGPGRWIDVIDLDHHYNPAEPRDAKGRWTEGLASKVKRLQTIFNDDSPPSTDSVVDEPPNPPELNQYDSFETLMYSTHPAKGENVSATLQHHAQERAQDWYDRGPSYAPGVNPQDEAVAQLLWSAYQNPSSYSGINQTLRGHEQGALLSDGNETLRVTPEQLRDAVHLMFQRAGTTTSAPMTVFRALRSKDRDWVDLLKPGSTFQEDGIVSSTAFRRMAQGWLGLKGTSDRSEYPGGISPDAVVLEIHVPTGSRIVGGTTQFIETMLPPGTKFKIRSQQRIRTPNAVNPIGGDTEIMPFVYTHIVADAILPDGFDATDFKPKPKHKADPKARGASLPRVQTAKRIAAKLAQKKPQDREVGYGTKFAAIPTIGLGQHD